MNQNRGLILQETEGYRSLLRHTPFAYHLDNARFVRFLHERAKKQDIRILDRTISHVITHSEDQKIQQLIDQNGESHTFDLYIDCTGFSSLLLGQSLDVDFIDYSTSLFNDRALVSSRPHHGEIKPYTTAKTMRHGWCWVIPTETSDHLGYVYSSQHCDEEQARQELFREFPGTHPNTRSIRFRSGRRTHCVVGNVIGIGNAYGFIEPLESTGLQLILNQVMGLANHLDTILLNPDHQKTFNRFIANAWDYYRWFLSIHFKFNRRIDSPYWRQCREETVIDGALPCIETYQSHAPLIYPVGRDLLSLSLQLYPYDVLLFGQRVPAQCQAPRESEAEHRGKVRLFQKISGKALTQRECLHRLRNELQESLIEQVEHPRSVLLQLYQRMEKSGPNHALFPDPTLI